ncbi:MAG: type II secretion system minor pseudopilin GspH [Paraglaciecola sp.]|uniref:type II secretion system minor pseudopilin GspH n=1 Tax=Paraglaciecola sp. TaxID=1920173 RepID=UPI00273F4D79|nr:type II secretion system minor pseudopilin GspH [Paraglaciecola sp.]MDP5030412.1 type II secretion system minor pseudopilin GspH [Paraglaciecola sp.]MDP5131459.1 type II secretion system minor pseudopilin GspH [Paraglaciecola sp.]
MTAFRPTHTAFRGFSLLEVMLVLVIMGLAASAIVFNFSGKSRVDEVKKLSQRFEVVFNMASDFAVLNQQTLGLRVEADKNEYHFLRLDDQQQWQILDGDPTFSTFTLPEEFVVELKLDDLPWDSDDSLFDNQVFDEELSVSTDGVEIGDEEEKKPEPPQVLILSSGEITPFSMLFSFEPEFGNESPAYFRVNGEDSIPLTREGPLDAP